MDKLECVPSSLGLGMDHLEKQFPDKTLVTILCLRCNELRMPKEQIDGAVVSLQAVKRSAGHDRIRSSLHSGVLNQSVVKLAHGRVLTAQKSVLEFTSET